MSAPTLPPALVSDHRIACWACKESTSPENYCSHCGADLKDRDCPGTLKDGEMCNAKVPHRSSFAFNADTNLAKFLKFKVASIIQEKRKKQEQKQTLAQGGE